MTPPYQPRPRVRDRCTRIIDDDTVFAPWLRGALLLGPPLPDRARAVGATCPCQWCQPPTGLHHDEGEGDV